MGTHPTWDTFTSWERWCWARQRRVAGVDEVGRGPLAGPVVAAAVILEPGCVIVGLDDSKRLTARQRAVLVPHIFDAACAISVAFVGPQEIDRINILEASRLAMRLALERLAVNPDVVLTDAMAVGGPWQEWDLLKGDTRSATIAAASVIAKEVRDHYMAELAEEYPGYGFEGHKGYGTPSHRAALERLGCSPAHRRTFVDHWMAPDHEPGMQS